MSQHCVNSTKLRSFVFIFLPTYIFSGSWLMTREMVCGCSTRNTLTVTCWESKWCLFLLHGAEIDMLHHLVCVVRNKITSVENISFFFSVRKCQYFKSNDNHFRTFVYFIFSFPREFTVYCDLSIATNDPTLMYNFHSYR